VCHSAHSSILAGWPATSCSCTTALPATPDGLLHVLHLPFCLSCVRGGGGPRDIHLENFSVSNGGKELVVDANVSLAVGRRYGLIGRNGTGAGRGCAVWLNNRMALLSCQSSCSISLEPAIMRLRSAFAAGAVPAPPPFQARRPSCVRCPRVRSPGCLPPARCCTWSRRWWATTRQCCRCAGVQGELYTGRAVT
jgi:hypothetical protein